MKICHITSVHKVDDVRINLKECMSLARDHEVTLLANYTQEYKSKHIKFVNLNKVFKNRFKRILFSNKNVLEKALKIDADIYHLHDPELLTIVLKLKKAGKKVVFDFHEDTPKQILGKYYIPKFLRYPIALLFKEYEKYIAKRIDGIICATPIIRNKFLKINKNTIDVKNYPLLEEFINIDNNYNEKKNQIVYIGGLSGERGIFTMINLANKLKDTEFVFCGDFSSNDEKNKAMNLIEHNNIIFTGYISREKIQEVLSKSSLGLVLLERNIRYMESLPIKMFEYMAAGIPVVASDFPLWKNILDESNAGIHFDPNDINGLAKKIQNLLLDKELLKVMGDNGKRFATEKYNWNNEASKLLKFYRKFEEDLK